MQKLALCNTNSADVVGDNMPPSSWSAKLELTIAVTDRGVRLVKNKHTGPLYVQKPFYPEGPDLAHIYLLHPPGGIVSGDDLSIDIDIGHNASALFTTPGAGRVYKARVDRALQHQHVYLNLAEQASAEWFPLENIVYPDAHGQLTTRVDLAEGASFMGWEISCLGLPASQLPFQGGEFRQRLEIYRSGQLKLVEAIRVQAREQDMMHGAAGFQGKGVNGIFIVTCSSDDTEKASLLTLIRDISAPEGELLAATHIDDFIVVRYLGECAHRARDLFVQCWDILRQAINKRPSCEPRIWMT